MYLLLRVKTRRRWQNEAEKEAMVADAPVDLVGDFRVIENGLSLFLVDMEKTRVTEIAVALAATKDNVEEVDYVLFDDSIVDATGLLREDTDGKVPDLEVAKWHQDLKIFTVGQLKDVIVHLWHHTKAEHLGRIEKFEVKNELISRIQDGRLIKSKVNKKLLSTLGFS